MPDYHGVESINIGAMPLRIALVNAAYMCSINSNGKHDKPVLTSTRLLDQLRERLRYMHYCLRTEKNYIYWVRWFIRWHRLKISQRHGGKEVEAFLSMLVNERNAAPSTHRQVLSFVVFVQGSSGYRTAMDAGHWPAHADQAYSCGVVRR
ncbi:phage integrase N-terminal SAM-like domain-containing protein [Noviherbaspirillum saxi]|uniref:phage integrase N-terminal SAM-like domain-containing protein n=1 Tax=Noviherbaspirillum saxi TaxID=2320863 RepID=UPI001F442B0D|nr:phage integrase N-terminal SAM-like domain-containing protein [Noviherbaspirillum saxi]